MDYESIYADTPDSFDDSWREDLSDDQAMNLSWGDVVYEWEEE